MTIRRIFLASLAALTFGAGAGLAQEVTLKLHQFLPAQANVPKYVLDVWADKVEAASMGRIKIDRFPSMQLGGVPPELMDQAVDGVADIIWTVVGYTPGRFPSTEVFELPFFVDDAKAGSYAFWNLYQTDMQDEFTGVHILGAHVHGQGVIHAADPVLVPGDLKGMKIRGASRQVNALLKQLGAEPVGMPVPAVTEALSKGVIDGTTIPWEVTTGLKVPELVEFHTEFTGPYLYTLTFVLAMNQGAYDAMPADLQAILDANSGVDFSVFAGATVMERDVVARQMAVDNGNEITTLDAEQSAAWALAAAPIYDAWIADVASKGVDGQALIDKARALMADYSAAQ